MAVKTDLTWQELQTELTAMGYANAVSVSGGKVMIDPGVINGEAIDSMTDTGVCETLYKLRQAAGNAQTTVNTPLPAEEQLTSFPPFSYSPPINDAVQVTQVSSYQIPLATSTVLGTN